MDQNNNNNHSTRPPPPLPPSRRAIQIPPSGASTTVSNSTPLSSTTTTTTSIPSKSLAPSPPPKPSSLSPVPPRKPISLTAAAIATISVNSLTPPIPAPRPPVNNSGNNSGGSISPSSISSTISSSAYNPPHASINFNASNGTSSAPASSVNSPTTSHSSSFSSNATGPLAGNLTASNSPAIPHLNQSLRSQAIPLSPSFMRSNSSASFVPPVASSSIAAKQQILLNHQQQQQQQQHNDMDHNQESINLDQDPEEDPFSDNNNISTNSTPTHPLAAPAPVPSPVPKQQNQSSLLTARLQGAPTSPSLHAPVPQHGSLSNSPRALSSPPPIPASMPVLPPRTRSPLAPSTPHQLHSNSGTPIPGRQNTFSASQRHSSVQPLPPSFPGQILASSLPSQPVPPLPRRASVQLGAQSTSAQQQQQQQLHRGPSPHFSAPGESGMVANASRFRNLSTPQQAFDHVSPQPKRVFSSSYAKATSPIPERGFATMELSDSQSDSDETSDDSDKDYDDAEEDNPSMTSNPFVSFVDASPRTTRAKTSAEQPPTLPVRPLSRPPPPRQPYIDQDSTSEVPPALPPKPAVRKKLQSQQDPGSLMSIGGVVDSESDPGRNPNAIHGYSNLPIGSGPSFTDGVFPDYSRSNRRLPMFSGVVGIQDTYQKSHGVRAFSISNEQIATATSNIRVYSVFQGRNISSYGHEKDTKPTALLFTQSRRPESLGQYLWAGWNEGSLHVIDTRTMEVVEKKRAAHKGGHITQIIRNKSQVWTVDDTGTVFIWAEDTMLCRPTIHTPLQSLTIPPKQLCAIAVQDMLWSSDGTRINIIRVGADAGRPKIPSTPLDIPFGIGPLTCMATIAGSGQVFSGHEDGKVIIWSIESRDIIRIVNVHAYRIMSLLGVGSYLWAGFATGKIYVLDLRPDIPIVMKDWQAHKDSGVAILQLDEEGLILGSRHQVGSCAESGEIKVWDGLMAKDRLTKGMVDRSKEYCQWRDLKVLICSWNIDASKPTAQDVADRKLFESWLTGMDQEGPPDIISVGFQEIVDLESKKMTAKSLLKGSKRAETETISKQYKRWQIYLTDKIRELYGPMGINFKLLECSNLVGLFSCVFVRDKEMEHIRNQWTNVDMVKTGLKGYHGNK
ncbi:hypothetical protein BGZ76_003929, partial [Entomortierella beljakovae]